MCCTIRGLRTSTISSSEGIADELGPIIKPTLRTLVLARLAIDAPVDARPTFIRKTYTHLMAAIYGLVALEFLYFKRCRSTTGCRACFRQRWGWLALFGGYMVVSWIADRWAQSDTSLGMQYAGLVHVRLRVLGHPLPDAVDRESIRRRRSADTRSARLRWPPSPRSSSLACLRQLSFSPAKIFHFSARFWASPACVFGRSSALACFRPVQSGHWVLHAAGRFRRRGDSLRHVERAASLSHRAVRGGRAGAVCVGRHCCSGTSCKS